MLSSYEQARERESEKIQINIFFSPTLKLHIRAMKEEEEEEEKLGTWCVWKASICERFIFGG